MKRILIAKDLAYANNKASAGANSATNPIDLLDGAVGVYGIPKTSANNKHKLALILDAGSDAAGKVPDSAYDGDWIVVAVGTADGARESLPIDLNGDIEISAGAYAAAVAGVWGVGYYKAGTVANLPTAVAGDVIGIKISPFNLESPHDVFNKFWEIKLDTAESAYSTFQRMADKLTDDVENTYVTVKVSQNIAGAAFANSATVTAVKGATSLTTSAAHGVGVGDYVSLGGDLYQAITGTTGSTLVLDRPYRGASATIANAAALDLGATVPTQMGLTFTGKTAGEDLIISSYGNLENADSGLVTAPSVGSGSIALLSEIEDMWQGRMGTATKRDSAYVPHPASMLPASGNFDVYTIKHKNRLHPKGDMARVTDVWNTLVLAFPDGGSAGGQAEIEDILGVLINGSDGIGGLDA